MLSVKMQAQVTDTIVIYETIVIYDTIKVYDTVKVKDENTEASPKKLKKNNEVQNAILVIDTTTQKAELVLFHENDTATISINNIILSENLNNSDTMKKKMVTLAASALLSQLAFAQENKTENKTISHKKFSITFERESTITDTASLKKRSIDLAEDKKIDIDTMPSKKFSIGGGLSGADNLFSMRGSALRAAGPSNMGGNLKLEYLIKKKWSVGIKSMITGSAEEDYEEYFGPGKTEHFTVNNHPGHLINISLISTYYIFGKNYKGKGGMYTTLGIGYTDFKNSDTQFSTADRYYTYTELPNGYLMQAPYGKGLFEHKERYKVLSGLLSFGADCKIGPGRLYAEIPISISTYYEGTYTYQDADGAHLGKTKRSALGASRAFFNLGYTLFF